MSREKAEGGGLWPWKVWGRATMVAARLSFAPPTEGGVLGEVGRSRTLVVLKRMGRGFSWQVHTMLSEMLKDFFV